MDGMGCWDTQMALAEQYGLRARRSGEDEYRTPGAVRPYAVKCIVRDPWRTGGGAAFGRLALHLSATQGRASWFRTGRVPYDSGGLVWHITRARSNLTDFKCTSYSPPQPPPLSLSIYLTWLCSLSFRLPAAPARAVEEAVHQKRWGTPDFLLHAPPSVHQHTLHDNLCVCSHSRGWTFRNAYWAFQDLKMI